MQHILRHISYSEVFRPNVCIRRRALTNYEISCNVFILANEIKIFNNKETPHEYDRGMLALIVWAIPF